MDQNAFYASDDHGLGFFDGIAGFFEQSNRVRGKAALDIETVRLPLMVDTGKIDRVLQIHTEIDDVQHHLQDGGDDARSARGAKNEKWVAIFQDDGGNHRRKRALARCDGVDFALYQPKQIGGAGLGREVIHFVVQQESGAWHGYAAAVTGVEGVSDGHDVSLFIGNAEMGCVRRFLTGGEARADLVARRSQNRIDRFAALSNARRIKERFDWILHEVRVAKIFATVCIKTPHDLSKEVIRGCGAGPGPFVAGALYHPDHLQDTHTAGPSRRPG